MLSFNDGPRNRTIAPTWIVSRMGGSMSVEETTLRRIPSKPPSWIFTPSHFLDQGNGGAITVT